MKKIMFLMLLLIVGFVFGGCSYSDEHYYDDGDSSFDPSPSDDGDYSFDPSLRDDGEGASEHTPQAGQLTASEWSDLKNYDFYLSLFKSSQESAEGVFNSHFKKGYFDTLNMIEVFVKNDDEKLQGVSVEIFDNSQNLIYKAITNTFGLAYLFPQASELDSISSISIKHDSQIINQDYQYSVENNFLVFDIDANNTHLDVIEIMFVIDTTGSMGDEIRYLKAEIDYVITRIKEINQNSTIRLALLFYRDFGDEYVTRYFGFTTNIAEQKLNLSKQSAAGGGDFEEAVDIALDEAVAKNWSQDNTTKLLFHVLDAPPHYIEEDMNRYYNAIFTASTKGIRMIPVASSGINKYTEYLLRNQAMMTGGTYVFITNDSGIGDDHIEATVGETVVEYLNHLLIRLVTEYHTGVEVDKIPYYNQD